MAKDKTKNSIPDTTPDAVIENEIVIPDTTPDAIPVLKPEHAGAMLEYKGEQISLENTSPEILSELYENEIWKYLFQ